MILNPGNISILYKAFNAAFKEGFGAAKPDHEAISMTVNSQTAEEQYGWLGQWPGLREWVGERTLNSISLHGYTLRNRKFESTIDVLRDNIEDDNFGVYAPMFQEMGRASATHPSELIYDLLKKGFSTVCYDGQYFFDSDHDVEGDSVSNTGGGSGTPWFLLDCGRMIKPMIFQRRRNYDLRRMDKLDDEQVFMTDRFRYGVDARVSAGYGLWQLAYGSKLPLTAANYETARKALLSIKGDQGRPLGITPTHLVVPPSLEGSARELLVSERTDNGGTNKWFNSAKLLCTPWLA